jgi:hypothetical protein
MLGARVAMPLIHWIVAGTLSSGSCCSTFAYDYCTGPA